MSPQQNHHRIDPILLQRAREMRHDPVHAERKLWHFLRSRKLNGYKFRRQEPIGPFIADFYCAEVRLIVELDGDTHAGQREYDSRRNAWFEENGYETIRFVNHYVHRELDAVLSTILRHCEDRYKSRIRVDPLPRPSSLCTGERE